MKHITHDERVLMRNVWEHLNTVYVKHGSLDLAYSQYHDLKDGCDFHEKLASTSVFLRHTLHTCIRDLFTSVCVWLSWHLHISHLVQAYFINQNFVVLEFFFFRKAQRKAIYLSHGSYINHFFKKYRYFRNLRGGVNFGQNTVNTS